MCIKFEELDLFEFFEKKPISVGEYEGGNWIYSYEQNDFGVILYISIYERYVEISITYKEFTIYSQKHSNIIEIKKDDFDNLRIISDTEKAIIIKKDPQIGVIVE